MTVGTAKGLNLMASLEISAGTALAARIKWYARLIGVSLLGLGLAGMAEAAFADQNVLAADNGTVHCDASLKDLTRVTLKDDQFASVSKVQTGNPAEDFQVVNEPLRGDIYLSVGSGFSKPSISFFGTTGTPTPVAGTAAAPYYVTVYRQQPNWSAPASGNQIDW